MFDRLQMLIKLLRDAGFSAVATHFEPRGAVRTNAQIEDILSILHEHCRQPYDVSDRPTSDFTETNQLTVAS